MRHYREYSPELEKAAKSFAAHIIEIANSSLQSKFLTEEDRANLDLGLKNFAVYFEQLAKIIDTYKGSKDSVAEYGYECLWAIVSGAFIIGSRGTTTESGARVLKDSLAARAREARAISSEEIALQAAIKTQHTATTCSQPSKEAAAILDHVNKYLKTAGFAPVKVDVIRRRLAKLPRS